MRFGTTLLLNLTAEEYDGLCRLKRIERSGNEPFLAEMYSPARVDIDAVTVQVWLSTLERLSEGEAEEALRNAIRGAVVDASS